MPTSIYDSERLAAAYAGSRPAVHPRIMDAARTRLAALGVPPPVPRALDIGCGVGLSTVALQPLASSRVGIEPVPTMLRHHAQVAPGARFVVGRAERIPFAAGAFDLVSAAGSLNYVDRRRALPEIARVLSPGGVLLIYDFSGGRRIGRRGAEGGRRDEGSTSREAEGGRRDDAAPPRRGAEGRRREGLGTPDRLDEWFASFERRHPYPAGYPMDVRQLDFAPAGLHLEAYEEFEVEVQMSGEAYLAYVMSETNVEQALREGAHEADIRAWCAQGIEAIFGGETRRVLFDAYLACVTRR